MTARKTPIKTAVTGTVAVPDATALLAELRQAAAVAVNAELTLVYWHIVRRITTGVLGVQRAAYGGEIVASLSRQWVADYRRGFEEKNLRRMVQFAEAFPAEETVVTLSRQLSGSRSLALLLAKIFKLEMHSAPCTAKARLGYQGTE